MSKLLKASVEGLKIVNLARRKLGWNKTSEIWCQTALTSKATLKRFWAQQAIRRQTFIDICKAVGIDNWEDVVTNSDIQTMGTALTDVTANSLYNNYLFVNGQKYGFALPENLPPVWNWVGRKSELETLKSMIIEPCQRLLPIKAICIVGLAGVGKTILASQLVRQLQTEKSPFLVAVWEGLHTPSAKPPQFDKVINSLLFNLSNGNINPNTIENEPLKKIAILIKLLQEKPCLIIFDQLETLLSTKQAEKVGYFADDYREYAWLFQQLLNAEHQSKIIFTSRESLAELPPSVTCEIQLTGLNNQDAVIFLKSLDLLGTPEEFIEVTQRYQGHPKGLELVAALIREHNEFQRRIGKFLQDRDWLLIKDIEILIDEMIVRLSESEQICLERISRYKVSEYPLYLAAIAAQMPEVSQYELKENIILGLKRRQLLYYDSKSQSYDLHPLVQEKAYRLLNQRGHPNFAKIKEEIQFVSEQTQRSPCTTHTQD